METREWMRFWARKYSPFISSTFVLVLQSRNNFGVVCDKLFIPEGKLHAMYFEKEQAKTVIDNYTSFLKSQNMPEFAIRHEGQFKDFLLWSQQETAKDFSSLSNEEVANEVKELALKLVGFGEIQFESFFVLEGAAKEIEQELKSSPDILQAITTPYKHTRITEGRIALLEMKREGRTTDDDIVAFLREYEWVPVYDFVDKPLTREAVREQLNAMQDPVTELNVLMHQQKEGTERYQAYLKTLADGDFKKLVVITHYFSYLKEMRDDYRRHAYYLWIPFWQEVARRLAMSIEEANALLPDEIASGLVEGTNYRDLAEKRLEKFAHQLEDGVLHTYLGEEADKVAAMVESQDVEQEIHGSTASKGMATGTVRVVYHQGEFDKFRDGDILVTTMTHPEFLPIMKKAKAIVTDEGGITCHAAIVSRELGVPCIIGTKIATKALNDGDLVEVDANSGTVKRLS